MEAFLVSTGIVALAEMGDKTQLLALILAARFRQPWPIVRHFCGNHRQPCCNWCAGCWVATVLGPDVLRWVLGASFIAMAVWMLIPDKMDDDETPNKPRFGVFGTTVVAFFLAEMGDKTQVATVMLAAQYQAYYWVIAGTTLGMMLANAPVVWLGERMTRLVPLRVVHIVSAPTDFLAWAYGRCWVCKACGQAGCDVNAAVGLISESTLQARSLYLHSHFLTLRSKSQ